MAMVLWINFKESFPRGVYKSIHRWNDMMTRISKPIWGKRIKSWNIDKKIGHELIIIEADGNMGNDCFLYFVRCRLFFKLKS